MNYYEHYIGDYAKRANHLTLMEHGALRLLLDAYYQAERPIPLNLSEAFRLCRAKTAREKSVVESVLREFFICTSDGWINHRCEAEIAKHKKKMAILHELRHRESYRQYRDLVLERDGFACVYCGCEGGNLQLDHVIPRSRGGADTPDNLVAACRSCNASKGAKTPQEWRQ